MEDPETPETTETQTETRTDAPAIAYRYVDKDGTHFVGVPPRDLTQSEFDGLSEENKTNVTMSGLYVPVEENDDA